MQISRLGPTPHGGEKRFSLANQSDALQVRLLVTLRIADDFRSDIRAAIDRRAI